MRKKSSHLQSISPVLDAMFRDLGISERIKLDTIHRRWSEVFSGALAEHTAPVDLKEGVLVIAVDSPVWLQHLKFMKKDIAAKLVSFGVNDIRLKHGNIFRDRESGDSIPKTEQPAYRQLTSGETEGIERAVTKIKDNELKDIVRIVLKKSTGRKRT
jgi:hypothetical protein